MTATKTRREEMFQEQEDFWPKWYTDDFCRVWFCSPEALAAHKCEGKLNGWGETHAEAAAKAAEN